MSGRSRLDRFVSKAIGASLREVQYQIARGEVRVNGRTASTINQQVDQFSLIEVDGKSLPNEAPVYLMMNKPAGVVSACKDIEHTTVLDLFEHPQKQQLHIVGRLDFNSTGLVLLTNDGHWSRRVSLPTSKLSKTYQVKLQKNVSDECVQAFARGMYFRYENLTTQAATLRVMEEKAAEVVLHEGKYHQIKRMFGRFDNPVLALHRSAVGRVQLDPSLQAGEIRALKTDEKLA
ncbi:MAG: pseudouridine synthase, partial [Pseudomonadales bacterium]